MVSSSLQSNVSAMLARSTFAVSGATAKGLSHAIALSSVGETTPTSVDSCITVSSENCVQLVVAQGPTSLNWRISQQGMYYQLLTGGKWSYHVHPPQRFPQIPRTEDCCLTLGVSYHGGGVAAAVRGGGGCVYTKHTKQCCCCCHDSIHMQRCWRSMYCNVDDILR